ncbi:MAG: tRNA (adenosine(37)-N6)-threonylcarbamoyltransferase complex dimerization subunit type 1 TsaB [Bacteroidales bacterium]
MTRILAIESSTTVCSVAVCDQDKVLALREVNDGYKHAVLLTRFIEEVLKETGTAASDLDAVAVSKGPGSYTGLRIGVSAAKGICFAHRIPLIAVSALEGIALRLAAELTPQDVIIPMIDAGRMEVYASVWSGRMEEMEPLQARIISGDSFDHLMQSGSLVLAGNGASKCRGLFQGNPDVIIRDDILPSARWIHPLANNALKNHHFEDLAYFEPLYLKEFVAGKPRVKGLF